MKEKLEIISTQRLESGGLVEIETYFTGRVTKEMLEGTDFEGKQIIYCTGWSNEPLTLIKSQAIKPAKIINVQDKVDKF